MKNFSELHFTKRLFHFFFLLQSNPPAGGSVVSRFIILEPSSSLQDLHSNH